MNAAPATGPRAPQAEPATDGAVRGTRRAVIVLLVLLLVVGAAGWWFLLRPAPDADRAPKPGEVLTLEPVQLNLADGHYLRLGLALQLAEGAGEVDGSRALDEAISLFSGRPMSQLESGAARRRLVETLVVRLTLAYDREVIDVYLTEFVMQ